MRNEFGVDWARLGVSIQRYWRDNDEVFRCSNVDVKTSRAVQGTNRSRVEVTWTTSDDEITYC